VGHAILFPPHPLSIFKSVKLSWTNALGSSRRQRGVLWQGRFFDPAPLPMNIFVAGRRRALRTVQEYWETVE
jgi:hypothetical protein